MVPGSKSQGKPIGSATDHAWDWITYRIVISSFHRYLGRVRRRHAASLDGELYDELFSHLPLVWYNSKRSTYRCWAFRDQQCVPLALYLCRFPLACHFPFCLLNGLGLPRSASA